MKVKKEIKIGIYVVGAIIVLYWGINFLKGKDIFGKANNYYATFEDVQGLQPTSNIYIRGLKIGNVESIKFIESNSNFVIKLRVDSKYNIPIGSIAKIYSTDLLGSKAIKIDLSDSVKIHHDGAMLLSGVEQDLPTIISSELTPIKDKLNKLLDQANVTFEAINKTLDEKTVDNLSGTIANLHAITGKLKDASGKVDALLTNNQETITTAISNMKDFTVTLKNNEQNINKTLTNLSNVSDNLAKANFEKIAKDIDNVIAKLNSGNGTLAKLINDGTLYTNLTEVTKNLDVLLKDLKENPKRYVHLSVFGRKSK